jgi:hypothetical protein
MKIIEIMLQLALRVTEMLFRISLELLVALLKGVGKLLGVLVSTRRKHPQHHYRPQRKARRERRKAWVKR